MNSIYLQFVVLVIRGICESKFLYSWYLVLSVCFRGKCFLIDYLLPDQTELPVLTKHVKEVFELEVMAAFGLCSL